MKRPGGGGRRAGEQLIWPARPPWRGHKDEAIGGPPPFFCPLAAAQPDLGGRSRQSQQVGEGRKQTGRGGAVGRGVPSGAGRRLVTDSISLGSRCVGGRWWELRPFSQGQYPGARQGAVLVRHLLHAAA